MDSIKHRILFLYSSPIGVANTGFFSPYWRCQYGLFFALLALPIRAFFRPIACGNTGSGSGYVLTCVARIRLRSFAISPFGLNTLRIEPPAGRLYLNAKTPSRPLGGLKAT